MICPKCGKRNKKDETKCVVCGKQLIKKNAKEKADILIDGITSSIDVKAIRKAEKSIIYTLKHLPSKVIISAVIILVLIISLIFVSIGFNNVSCTYKSKEDNLAYRSNITFNYKDNKITRFSMRLEYSARAGKNKEDFAGIYDNIIDGLKSKENYNYIVKSSSGSRHFSIVYNFNPSYIDQVYDYTGFSIDEYDNINDFIKELEGSGFKCR